VIKDSWVHDSRATREESILWPIQGMVGVPELISAWTVKIGGTDDKTDICRFPLPYSGEVRIHCWLLMKPVAIPISEFESVRELLSIFIDILDGTSEWLSCSFANLTMHTVHQRLVVEFNILHHDISVNNIMMYDSVKEDNKAKASCGAKLPHNDNETPPPRIMMGPILIQMFLAMVPQLTATWGMKYASSSSLGGIKKGAI